MPTIFGKLLASTPRFLKIDDQNRGDHSHLTAADECYFLYEYTSRRNYSFSSTNQLISNLKKRPSQASANEYRYKLDDVLTAGTHYVAVKTMLQRHYPGVPIVGFFVARRVFPV
jgi:hypothetical protein